MALKKNHEDEFLNILENSEDIGKELKTEKFGGIFEKIVSVLKPEENSNPDRQYKALNEIEKLIPGDGEVDEAQKEIEDSKEITDEEERRRKIMAIMNIKLLHDSVKAYRAEIYKRCSFQNVYTNFVEILNGTDFHTDSKIDSMRLKSYMIYKNGMNEDGQVMETTENLMKSTDKMYGNAYDFINSQDTVEDMTDEEKVDLNKQVSGDGVILLPENGDETKLRVFYKGKDGNIHLTPAMDKLKSFSELSYEMLSNKEKYPDFPRPENGKMYNAEEKKQLQKLQHKATMEKWNEILSGVMPEMENPAEFMMKITTYQSARVNFQFSEFGEKPEATEEEVNEAKMKEMKKRAWEHEVLSDYKLYPEFYADEETANARGKMIVKKVEAGYESDDAKIKENDKYFQQHPFDECYAFYKALKEDDISPVELFSHGKILDSNGQPYENKNYPWEAMEKAAIDGMAGKPIYIQKGEHNEKLFKAKYANGELAIENEPLTDKRDERTERENIKYYLLQINEKFDRLGDTSGDSEEYKKMRRVLDETIRKLSVSTQDPHNNHSLITADNILEDLSKLSNASNEYFFAKADQSMNSRRAARFEISSRLRKISSLFENKKKINDDMPELTDRMKEWIAAKMTKKQMLDVLKKNKKGLFDRDQRMFDECKINSRKLQGQIDNYLKDEFFKEYVKNVGNKEQQQYADALLKKFKSPSDFKLNSPVAPNVTTVNAKKKEEKIAEIDPLIKNN